jgi:hypothetical protein
MKLVFRTFAFHILCILFFGILYYNLTNSFADTSANHKNKTFLDFILLATTIQAGIGFNFLDPINNLSKICVILQQLIMISTHIITLYIFTL